MSITQVLLLLSNNGGDKTKSNLPSASAADYSDNYPADKQQSNHTSSNNYEYKFQFRQACNKIVGILDGSGARRRCLSIYRQYRGSCNAQDAERLKSHA